MLKTSEALKIYYIPQLSHYEYRNFIYEQIKDLIKKNDPNAEFLNYLPESVRKHILNKITKFKLKTLINPNQIDPDKLALRFYNSLLQSKKDRPFVILMLKYAHDFYLKSQNKKPKYCPVYIDNLKLLLKGKKNPSHNFKKEKATEVKTINNNIVIIHTLQSCEGKERSSIRKSKNSIKTYIKIFSTQKFAIISLFFKVNRDHILLKHGSIQSNFIALEAIYLDKETLDAYFSKTKIFSNYKTVYKLLNISLSELIKLAPPKLIIKEPQKEERQIEKQISKEIEKTLISSSKSHRIKELILEF